LTQLTQERNYTAPVGLFLSNIVFLDLEKSKSPAMKVNQTYLFILAFWASILPSALWGQAGYVDTSYYKGQGVDFKCTGGLVQPDSSILIIGRFGFVNQRNISGIAKLNQKGEVDYGFNVGTGADEHVNQIVRQPDGKIIIAGDFRTFNGDSVFHIIRLNPDGSRDNSFNMGTGFTTNGTVYALYLQPDGKILAGGIFIDYNGNTANYLTRINSDGSFDNTFNIGTGFNNTVYSIDRQTDGKYIIAGNFTSVNGDTLFRRIVRLHTNGTVDTTFQSGLAGFNNIVTRAKLQANGKILAVGFFTNYQGTARNRIARLNSDGSLDFTFNPGNGFNSNVNDMVIQADGKIYATGNFTNYKGSAINRIVRIDTTGNRDASFAPGTGLNLSCNTVFLNYNNTVFVGGTATQADSFARFRLVRFLSTGKVDHSFFEQSKINGQTYVAEAQSSGKVIVGGAFTRYNQVMANRIVRLNTNGTVDTTFKSGTGANNSIRALKVLPNNKIIIGGDFTIYNGKAINRIARLNADGSLDTTFSVGSGANGTVYHISVDMQGRIYVGGNFALYNSDSVFRLVRLNANGLRDNSFLTGAGFNNYVYRTLLQPDGKLLACGAFTAYNGVAQNRVIRLNTDGSADASFSIGSGANNVVYAMELADSGSIVLGGRFTSFKGVSKARIVKVDSGGNIQPFSATAGNNIVYDIKRLKNGFLLGGTFTSVTGNSRSRIAYVDSVGSVNTTQFYTGSGLDNVLYYINVDTVQQCVYLAGNFSTVQSQLCNRFARLSISNIRLTQVALNLCPGAITKVYFDKNGTYYAGNVFTVQLSDSNGSFGSPVNIGAKSSSANGIDSVTVYFPNNLPSSSSYRIRILSSNLEDVSNLSLPITIGASIQPTVSILGSPTFCGGDSVILSASEGTSFNWSSGASTQSIIVKNSGAYTVTVNNNNCIGASVPVTIAVTPAPDSTISFEIASLCGSGSVKLSGQPGLSYAWNIGPTSQSITISQDGTYTLSVTDTSGCKSSSSVNLNLTAFFNTLVYAQGPTTICEGSSVILRSFPGLNSYQWSSGQTTDSITVSSAGVYQVTVSDGICSKTSNAITVSVNPLPVVSFSLPQDTFCHLASSVTLSGSPSGGTFVGNGVTSSTFSPAGLGNSNAIVTYSYTDGNNCTGIKSDTAYVAICTGVENIADNALAVFPNPASENIYISGLATAPYHIEVTNALGGVVLKLDVSNSSGTEKLNLSGLTQGHYVLSVGSRKFRFMKQ
jgi:uncharacterized delta-60 repeat protein